MFDGNTGDPKTLAAQVEKLKQRFGLDHVVLVGDRGMITQARLTEDVKAAGLDWITALRAPAIKDLVKGGVLQLSLFDERDMASITSLDFHGRTSDRLLAPELAAKRARKRQELLDAAWNRSPRVSRPPSRAGGIPLHGATEIAQAMGAVVEKRKMRRHFKSDRRRGGKPRKGREKGKIANQRNWDGRPNASLSGQYRVSGYRPRERI